MCKTEYPCSEHFSESIFAGQLHWKFEGFFRVPEASSENQKASQELKGLFWATGRILMKNNRFLCMYPSENIYGASFRSSSIQHVPRISKIIWFCFCSFNLGDRVVRNAVFSGPDDLGLRTRGSELAYTVCVCTGDTIFSGPEDPGLRTRGSELAYRGPCRNHWVPPPSG